MSAGRHDDAPVRLTVLGSGSRGNCSVLRLAGDRLVLVDCGLSPRRVRWALDAMGLRLEQVSDVLLTHLDRDHFLPGWGRVLAALHARVHLHRSHRARALRSGVDGRTIRMFEDRFRLPAWTPKRGRPMSADESPEVESVRLAHDELGTYGFVIEQAGVRVGWATDLGRVPPSLLEAFVDLDAVAIESNYDPGLQRASGRPDFLKQRVMGGSGHLSNEQSLDAVRRIAETSDLAAVVTLHLSQDCNRPELVTALYRERAPRLAKRLVLTSQGEPSVEVAVRAGVRRGRCATAAVQGELFPA